MAASENSNIRFENVHFKYINGEQLHRDRVQGDEEAKPVQITGSKLRIEKCLFAGAMQSALRLTGEDLYVGNCVFTEKNRYATFDHPNMIPYLSELLGPQFRADHDYGIFMRQGGRKGGLHGGDHRAGTHYYKYRDGVMRNGLTVVVYFLAPAPPGSGGFCCVPGSHKSNFALNVPEEVRSFKCIPHYLANPSAETGDALIFTEATMHGTLPWTAENERRTLLYKFTPGHVSYASTYYNHDDYEDLTEQQKRVLTPPSARRPNVVETA